MKFLKKYKLFTESINGYRYGVVMLEIPNINWDEIIKMIDPEDLYHEKGKSYGIQHNPHVTLLFGLHKGVSPRSVKQIFKSFDNKIDIEINGIDTFETNPYFDVVKFNVNPQGALQYLFDRLSELPNSNEFPNFMPHITIAFVKKGTGKKYINPEYKHIIRNIKNVTYSMSNGMKSHFDVSGN